MYFTKNDGGCQLRAFEHAHNSDCHLTAPDVLRSQQVLGYRTADHDLTTICIYKDFIHA
jgi:hypothetical protein